MARMVPPIISRDVKSGGEKILFEEFRNAPDTEDWICLHSLGISAHREKVYGEIDFVLLVPGKGVVCFEVKSGRVSRKNGIWEYTNRDNKIVKDMEGPIHQVRTGCYALRKKVREHFGQKHKIFNAMFSWGVMFPQCKFDAMGVECEEWQIYSQSDRDKTVKLFVDRLAENSRKKLLSKQQINQDHLGPSKQSIQDLLDYLRGDFEFGIKPGLESEELQNQIIRFTSEQYRCLESLHENSRCFFSGASGTGKTVLSVEFAKRQAHNGNKVLFLCSNKFLVDRLRSELDEFLDSVTPNDFSSYLKEIVNKSTLKLDFEHDVRKAIENCESEKDKNLVQMRICRDYAEMVLDDSGSMPFDVLIVDEAENLIVPKYLDIMNLLVKDGLQEGHWAFFADLHSPKIETGFTADDMKKEITKRAPVHASYSLVVNCRNTINIGKDVCKMSGLRDVPFEYSKVSGPPVTYEYYSQETKVWEKLNVMVRELANQGIHRKDIVILSPTTFEESCLSDYRANLSFDVFDITKENKNAKNKDFVTFSTIRAYKGFESAAVIIIGITELHSDESKYLFYLSMSRALIRLLVILPAELKKEVNRLLK